MLTLAKAMTAKKFFQNPPPAKPISTIKRQVKDQIREWWTFRWTHEEPCRQTKDWFPAPNSAFAFKILANSRLIFSKLVQIITGHNFWKYHEHLVWQEIDEESTPQCDLCNLQDSRQSTFHIFANCEAVAAIRMAVFGVPFLPSLLDVSKDQIIRFLSEIPIGVLPFELS